MPSTLHTHDLILRLKKIHQEQHLTPQIIYDLLENSGYHVSINTIKKVFSDGSEDEHFRYHDTLEPIAKVLLNLYDDQGDAEAVALKADLAVKDELIERRERELEDCCRKLEECRADSRTRIEYLKHQIELKDQRIDKLMARVDVLLAQLQNLLEKM